MVGALKGEVPCDTSGTLSLSSLESGDIRSLSGIDAAFAITTMAPTGKWWSAVPGNTRLKTDSSLGDMKTAIDSATKKPGYLQPPIPHKEPRSSGPGAFDVPAMTSHHEDSFAFSGDSVSPASRIVVDLNIDPSITNINPDLRVLTTYLREIRS